MTLDPNQWAVTPNRASRLLVNAPQSLANQPAVSEIRAGRDIAPTHSPHSIKSVNTTPLPSGSWTVPSWQQLGQFERDGAAARGLFSLSIGGLTAASGFVESPYTGPFSPASPNAAITAGNRFVEKTVPAGSSWDATLGTVETSAFPPPYNSGLPTYQPGPDSEDDERVWPGGQQRAVLHPVHHPAGSGRTCRHPAALLLRRAGHHHPAPYTGGRFSLVLYGNGFADLYEWRDAPLSSDSWNFVWSFSWSSPGAVYGNLHRDHRRARGHQQAQPTGPPGALRWVRSRNSARR